LSESSLNLECLVQVAAGGREAERKKGEERMKIKAKGKENKTQDCL
jgi:hypothetical protein